MADATLKTLYTDELRDLLDAEKQLLKAIPKMAEASGFEPLRSGFEHHLEQTKNHARRIEQILEALDESPKGKKCKGMQGIVNEGKEVLERDYEGAVKDTAIISMAQRVEHYEIAAYRCVQKYAQLLSENEAASLLGQTLEEEQETDRKLAELSDSLNSQAASVADRARSAGA